VGKYFLILVIGVLFGGYLFSEAQPRSLLSINHCINECYKPNDLAGLLTSVGISKLSGAIPSKVLETNKTIVIKHPFPEARVHYVIFPKKDIKNAGVITKEDMPYLQDAFFVMAKIIEQEKLKDYRIITNGPGFQHTTYLHFHLRAN
jgi:histidine triad (HIT) family protein